MGRIINTTVSKQRFIFISINKTFFILSSSALLSQIFIPVVSVEDTYIEAEYNKNIILFRQCKL